MDDATKAQQDLEKFVNRVLDEKNLPGLSDDDRPAVVAQMVQELRELIDRAIIEALPEDKLDQLNELINKQDVTKEQVVKIVKESGVDSDHVAAVTMLRFRDLYLNGQGGESR